jgi:NAD(P)-dependent dehydrogenase (short-subunit alcohol dehydrogenase family)
MTEPVALVTGAGQRLGRAFALALAEDGHAVAVHVHRSLGAGEAVVDEIRALGRRAVLLGGDLAAPETAALVVEQAAEALGPVSVLVNNAASFAADRLASLDPARFDREMALNLRAPLLMAQAMARALPLAGTGVIVNLLDQRVRRPSRHHLSYTLSKSALWTATLVLAQELAPRIRVVGIAPGAPLPEATMSEEVRRALADRSPLGEPGSLADCVAALRFLVAARSVTGEVVVVDGGISL